MNKSCAIQLHTVEPGKPTWKINISSVLKDITIKGAYKVDKNNPGKHKILDCNSKSTLLSILETTTYCDFCLMNTKIILDVSLPFLNKRENLNSRRW